MPSPQEKLEKKLLHYTGKAISEFNMIEPNDKIMVCLSGGKDSFTLLYLLHRLKSRAAIQFDFMAYTLDQQQPGWDDSLLKQWLNDHKIPFFIQRKDTYSIVKSKLPENATYCSLCSRLRRGIIYKYAKEHGFTKIALGHHRDDLIRTLLMSIFFNGEIRSMPPKLLSDDKQHIVIRPLVYCQENDIKSFSQLLNFPIIPCNLCGSQENLMRKKVGNLISQLSEDNPKIPSNMLHALSSLKPSQLMDKKFWDFKQLEKQRNKNPMTENELETIQDDIF